MSVPTNLPPTAANDDSALAPTGKGLDDGVEQSGTKLFTLEHRRPTRLERWTGG